MTRTMACAAAALLLGSTAALAQGVPLGEATLTGDEVIDTPVGSIELEDSYFGDDASRRLFDESDFQRATQAFL